ncbi:MAG: ribonuclease R, partial [Bacteroidetes bacterium]|nr:ribonuclease R [Bacteroidota bacterium]
MPTKSSAVSPESLQERILQFLARFPNESFKLKEISRRIGIRSPRDEQLFKQALRSLQDDKKILRIRGKKYSHLHKAELLTGKLEITPRGFGIVIAEENGEELFIRQDDIGEALHGDTVEVSLFARSTKQFERGARREGEVVRIIKRGSRSFVGKLEQVKRQFFVVPDNRRMAREILIGKDQLKGAREGDKVIVEMTASGEKHQKPQGRVVEVLGRSGDMYAEIQSVVREYNLPVSFPEDVIVEANAIPADIPESEVKRRMDLRRLLCFTIDPEDAKDFDDAVSLELLPDGHYRLGVHIADVSYYIKTGSALDKEALKRSTSVYFPAGVIPMLPEKISNGLCSLRQDEDRLTFTVFMNISPRGSVKDYEIVESIIRSSRRFSYENVQEIINNLKSGNPISADGQPYADILQNMYKLSTVLTKKRLKEGSIDFDSAEAKFKLDDDGRPVGIMKKERLESHRLVEEFMLMANRVVARHIGLAKKEEKVKPFLYRVHDSPDPERIGELAAFVGKFGFKLNIDGGVTSKSLQRLLDQIKGTEVENVINEVVLRSMAKAIYSERNTGHYGLAFDYYSHFTSPIRRYPDLIVHRMLKLYNEGITPKEMDLLHEKLPVIAKQTSAMERLAMEAERSAVKVMQVEYMKRHIGDEFKAVISGVTHFGIFVELIDSLVEGMIHVRDLNDDYYEYDEKQYAFKGRRTH